MKKKSDDKQSVADLLKKLQESYLGSSPKASAKKKQDTEEETDKKFRQQLAAMLGRAEAPDKKKKKKKKQEPHPIEQFAEELEEMETVEAAETSEPLPTKEETVARAETLPTENATAVPDTPPPIEENPKKKKSEKKKRDKKRKSPKSTDTVVTTILEDPLPPTSPLTAEETPPQMQADEEDSLPGQEEIFVSEERFVPDPPAMDETEDEPISESVVSEELSFADEAIKEQAPDETSDVPVSGADEPVQNGDSMIFISLRRPKPIPEPKKEMQSEIVEAPQTQKNAKDAFEETEEAEEPTSPPIAETPLQQPTRKTASSSDERVIRITPPAREKREEPPKVDQKSVASEPIRIQPKTADRRSDAVQQQSPSNGAQPIVIRPVASHKPSSDAIVIRPRPEEKPIPTPTSRQEPISTEPIKIGKESRSEIKSDPQSLYSEATTQMMQKEKNRHAAVVQDTNEMPPAESKQPSSKQNDTDLPKKPASASKKPGISLPRKGESRDFAFSAKSAHRRTVNSIPVTTLPDDGSDDMLDEALEDVSSEEIPLDAPIDATIPSENQRRADKPSSTGANLSATEQARRQSGLSEDDISMIFELGYENELERLVGHEMLKQMKNEHLKRSEQGNHRHYRTAFGYRGEEVVSTQQGDTVRAAYLHDRKYLLLRLCLTVLFSLVALFADMPRLLGAYLTDLTADLPFALPLAGMLALFAVAALSWKQLNAGIRSFFKFSPTPYSVPALLLPFATAYDVVLFFVKADMLKVNFLVCFAFLILAVCDIFRLTTEMRVLRLLSEEGPKTVLAPSTPRKKKLRQGDKIVKIINDDLGKNMYHVKKALQTSGFFRRFNSMESAARPFTIMICTSIALSVLSALVNAIYTSSFLSALSAFMTVLLLGAPLGACLMYFYPIARANRLLASRDCALIGEESVEEYREPKTVIFRDSALYTAEKCTEIAVREEDDFKNDLRLAGILFRKLGGTLKRIGESARTSLNDPPVSVLRIHDNGVEAIVDNRNHMVVGGADFLKRAGIRVPRESTDKILRRTANTSLMYVAIDGSLKLSYEIQYSTNPSFENLVCDLFDTGVAVAIHSYDPNLEESFLQKSRADLAVPIHAVKPGRFEEDKPLETVDTGAVALGKTNDIVYPLYAAKGIESLRRFGTRIQLIAALLATASSALLSIFGQHQALGLLPILGYQLLWIAVSAIASFSELNAEKLRFLKKE